MAARYPLYYSNRITSLVIDHNERSERMIKGDKLVSRLRLLLEVLQKDKAVMDFFGKDFKKIQADSYSYIALHIGQGGKYKKESLRFYLKSLSLNPAIAFNKRFYVIMKNLLTKW
jgi:hypothetical protein